MLLMYLLPFQRDRRVIILLLLLLLLIHAARYRIVECKYGQPNIRPKASCGGCRGHRATVLMLSTMCSRCPGCPRAMSDLTSCRNRRPR
ncbi:hypothetical protein BJX76DRAFT_286294 [Aspergillus varians]